MLNRKVKPVDPHNPRRSAITAAAVPINLGDSASWQMFKLGDHRWQWEAWRHYDICGEMRFVVNWIGNAVSRCRLYAAEVGPDGTVGDEVTDETVKTIAETMFGTPAAKAQAQRLMGINMMVAGDCYVVAEGYQDASSDVWYVCSSSEVYRRGDEVMVRRSITHGGGQYRLDPEKDLLIRAWNPHPRRYDAADSTVRAILPVLREIEQCTKRVFAELDSRLAGNGLLILPQEIDFPRTDADPDAATSGLDNFSGMLQRTMALSLQNRDSSAAVTPIVIQVPTDAVDKIKHLMFDSKISDQVETLRKSAVERMAMSLDIPPEVLLGMGGRASHWNAWQIEESSIKIHVEPLLIQLADALNIGYFQPALKAAGVQDPEKKTLWFDIAALAVRPNRSDQALQFSEKGLISDASARGNSAFTEDDAPSKDEQARKLLTSIVLAQPAYAADPEVQKFLGLPKFTMPAPPAPPAPPGGDSLMPGEPGYDTAGEETDTEPADARGRGLPRMPKGLPTVQQAESGKFAHTKLGELVAGINHDLQGQALFYAADSAVYRALELAGGRLVPGPQRGRYGVPKHELHTQVLADESRVSSLLAGAWQYVREQAPKLGVDADALETLLAGYCRELLVHGHPHRPELLQATLAHARGDLVPA